MRSHSTPPRKPERLRTFLRNQRFGLVLVALVVLAWRLAQVPRAWWFPAGWWRLW